MVDRRTHSRSIGFTLVELLVAMLVLAILVTVATQLLHTAGSATILYNKHNDANNQARAVFDRMSYDFARMVRRKDVDYLFWKNSAAGNFGPNDAMYFYTEGASYFDNTTFNANAGIPPGASNNSEKNLVSLVGYRINSTAGNPAYNQMERLGKPLSWDGGAYNATQAAQNSLQPNFMVFLSYPPMGNDVINGPSNLDTTAIPYSTAYFDSTLAGAYGNSGTPGALPNAVGTQAGGFINSTDTSYRTIGSQVFRFEYAFQLKDGSISDKPIMAKSASNGIPSSYLFQTLRPLPGDDSVNTNGNGACVIGTRWYDTTNQIGYICLDATPNKAVWHEIGIQDISSIIVTIAVIDRQGIAILQSSNGDIKSVAAQLPDYSATATATGDPAYLLDTSNPKSWAYALLPGNAVSQITGKNKLPQSIISQIRIYQRHFYLNTF